MGHALRLLMAWHQDSDGGDIIVFFSGRANMEAFHRLCEPLAGLQIRMVTGWKNEAATPNTSRVAYFVTNAVQTGVTLPAVSTVVDFGTKKEMVKGELKEVLCSQSELKQRAGRAGRTRDGICHHILTEVDMMSRPAFPHPESERVAIDHLLLQMLTFSVTCTETVMSAVEGNLEARREVLGLFPHQASMEAISDAWRELERFIMVNDSGLTEKGLWCAMWGLEPSEAFCLAHANALQCGDTMALLLASRKMQAQQEDEEACEAAPVLDAGGDLMAKAMAIQSTKVPQRIMEDYAKYWRALCNLGQWVRPARIYQEWHVAHSIYLAAHPGHVGSLGRYRIGRRTYRAFRNSCVADKELTVAHSWVGFHLTDVEPVTQEQLDFGAYLGRRKPEQLNGHLHELAMELAAVKLGKQLCVSESVMFYLMLASP